MVDFIFQKKAVVRRVKVQNLQFTLPMLKRMNCLSGTFLIATNPSGSTLTKMNIPSCRAQNLKTILYKRSNVLEVLTAGNKPDLLSRETLS